MQSTVERLLAQAWPAQVQRLRAFGAERPYLQELARRPEERLRAMPEEELDRRAASSGYRRARGAPSECRLVSPVVAAAHKLRVSRDGRWLCGVSGYCTWRANLFPKTTRCGMARGGAAPGA